MGFANVQGFEKLLSDHDGTLGTLKGQNIEQTLENIGDFFITAILFVEYNQRNGIDICMETQNELIKLGAAI
jgi:hypothetical protein